MPLNLLDFCTFHQMLYLVFCDDTGVSANVFKTLQGISDDAQLNYEQNMHDAMAVFHKLQTGLDVNVKFTG